MAKEANKWDERSNRAFKGVGAWMLVGRGEDDVAREGAAAVPESPKSMKEGHMRRGRWRQQVVPLPRGGFPGASVAWVSS